eukprot:3594087-Alexandrium_andersonii.AAC.1
MNLRNIVRVRAVQRRLAPRRAWNRPVGVCVSPHGNLRVVRPCGGAGALRERNRAEGKGGCRASALTCTVPTCTT